MIASVHHRATRGLISLCAAASLAGLAPAVASAGSYDVQVCRNGYGNSGALSASGAGAQFDYLVRVTNNCDGGYYGWNGITASITDGPQSPQSDPYVPVGTSANIYTSAPPNTGIRKIHVDMGRMASYYGNTTGWNARVMIPSLGWCRTDGDGGNWCGLGYQTPADNSGQNNWATPDYPHYENRDIGPITGDVADMAIGVVCNGGSTIANQLPCYRPQYRDAAGVSIVSAAISVDDHSAPTISALSGPVTDGAWHQPGPIGFGVTGWDNTGIRSFQRILDGADDGSIDQGCDYSLMKPCQDRAINDNINVTGYDGFHTVTLRAWDASNYNLDCTYDCADTSTAVKIDGTAPDAPASANPGPAWSNANGFNLIAPTPASEIDPDGGGPQARSTITHRIVTICPSAQPTSASCVTQDAPAVNGQVDSASITVPGEGDWQARVQLQDDAGHRGAPSAPVSVRYDKSAPTLAVNQARGGFTIIATDALSHPASVTYRVDGKGDWVTTSGVPGVNPTQISATVATAAGQHYVEVKGTDSAGNTSLQVQRFDVTVPDNDQSVSNLDPFGTDSQVAVVDRGGINGVGGGETATLTASFVRGAKSKNPKPLTVRTINDNGTASIQGQLVGADGRGITNARIDLGVAIAGGGTSINTGVAQTDDAGRFTIPLGKGLTSRGLTVAYMARVNDSRPVAAAGLSLVVKAQAKFKVRNPHVGRTWFTGTVSNGGLTKQGVEVKLQWKVGRRFSTFTTVRTDIAGHWKTSWNFKRHGARYLMRALVTSSPGYAYKGAASRPRMVGIK